MEILFYPGGKQALVNSAGLRRDVAEHEVLEDVAAVFFAGEKKQVPQSVSPRQMLKALDALEMLDAIEAYVATLPRSERIDWERASEFYRDNATIEKGRIAFGLTHEFIDDLFRLAGTQ